MVVTVFLVYGATDEVWVGLVRGGATLTVGMAGGGRATGATDGAPDNSCMAEEVGGGTLEAGGTVEAELGGSVVEGRGCSTGG